MIIATIIIGIILLIIIYRKLTSIPNQKNVKKNFDILIEATKANRHKTAKKALKRLIKIREKHPEKVNLVIAVSILSDRIKNKKFRQLANRASQEIINNQNAQENISIKCIPDIMKKPSP